MVLELLFEYGEHESSSVAQILNVVRKYVIDKQASGEPNPINTCLKND